MVKGLCYCVSLCHRLSHFSLVPSFCLIPHNLKIISGFLVPFKFCIIIFLVISNFLTMCSQFSLQGSLILNLSLLVCFLCKLPCVLGNPPSKYYSVSNFCVGWCLALVFNQLLLLLGPFPSDLLYCLMCINSPSVPHSLCQIICHCSQ